MPSELLNTLSFTTIVVWVYMSIWYIIALIIKRNDVADIAWGLGFVVASVASLLFTGNQSLTAVLTTALVLIWGLRLSWHIGQRNIKKSEDYRYKAWREQWGKWLPIRSYLQIFILQGLLMLIIVSPVLIINTYAESGVYPVVVIGAIVWLVGFIFESVGDRQLKNFLRNPKNKGKLMTEGLWQYSRHPNYFGEITQWWAIGLIALSCSYGWLGLVGPAMITYLIVKVSGVPLLENKYADRPDFKAYKLRTSMLIPLPPKNG